MRLRDIPDGVKYVIVDFKVSSSILVWCKLSPGISFPTYRRIESLGEDLSGC